MKLFVVFLSGILFGLGLFISEMTNPAKVIGFLDIFGKWDPSLLLVMVGAISIYAPVFWFFKRRNHPIFENQFHIPTHTKIDRKLLIGSMIFGIGWGLAGICPGPAIVNLAKGNIAVIVFVGCMLIGMGLYRRPT